MAGSSTVFGLDVLGRIVVPEFLVGVGVAEEREHHAAAPTRRSAA